MPVGIPKLPFQGPEDEESSWVDLYNRLYRQRFLFLGDEINDELSNTILGLMIYLNIEDKTKDFYLFINSPGGWVISGMAIYDTMESVGGEVYTINVGLAASMASIILMGGTDTRRTSFPRARVMIHQPWTAPFGAITNDLAMDGDELLAVRETITRVYVQRTGKPIWVVSEDMERDVFMSATEAQAHGIVDLVAVQ
uniref:ATP-dependent Clp protease proteolytic subunit n=1 Tax=Siphonostegia chinensis TaxID=374729 RepID=A0A6B9XR42_9LAMI|nr:ATP-dependent Clp protease proteolytic subunit [Siphonostegia chinensis]QHR84972.1 ATP-dependent Clp protease proteolytic subunit [Siphonostegia chinensis]